MDFNFYIVFVAALIPMIIGAIWYHDRVFGKAWLSASGLHPDIIKTGNMLVIFGASYVFCLFIALTLSQMVVHQFGFFQMLQGYPELMQEGTEINLLYQSVMEQYGSEFRTFSHGALHGGLAGLMMALPFVGVTALFERRGWKYIFIHSGYWFISLVLMGGLICAFF